MNLSKFKEYIKVHATWKNKPDKSTPIDAAALMQIETGIKSNNEAIQELAAAVINQITNDPNKIASMAALYSVNQTVTQLSRDFATAKYVSDLLGAQNIPTFVRWDTNTANTPYKAGLTGGAAEGFAMVYGNYSTWLTAVAWVKGAGGSQYIFSVDQGNVKGWTQVASKDDLKDNAPDFAASETLLAWANSATRNTSKCIKSGTYPSDAPSTSGEWIAEVIITQWRRIVRVTGYNTASPAIYIRSIYNNAWQSGWAQK